MSPVIMKLLLTLCILLYLSRDTQAVILNNLNVHSNEFLIGFPEHLLDAYTLHLYVHTSSVDPVSFTVKSGDGMFTYNDNTSYNNPATVYVPLNYEVRGREYSWRNKGIHITSPLAPISVVAWSYYNPESSIMSYLALPCSDQPTNSYTYYVISTYGLSGYMSQFLIVGCTDNTSVTIIPNNNITVPVDPQNSSSNDTVISFGQAYNFTLHSLQTMFIYEPYVDLTGSKIISDKPLTIISGHEASQVPHANYHPDSIATQLVPTINWGKTFLLPPHSGRSNGQSYRIIAIHENTTAVRTCGLSTINISFDSNNTNWFFTSSNTYCSIVSDKPISVYQIGVSRQYNSGTNGDPTLNTIPPMEQYDHSATTITSLYNVHSYYSVIIPNDEYYTGQLKINDYNQNITFIEIYNSSESVIGYGYSSSFTGTSTIEHPLTDGRLFISVYGWATNGGYAYTGGMKLNPINIDHEELISVVSFTMTEYSVIEGSGIIYVSVERMMKLDSNFSVCLHIDFSSDNTAGPNDYSLVSSIIDFFIGESVKNVSISITDDSYAEPLENFTLRIKTNPTNYVVYPKKQITVNIIDNDDVQVGFSNDQFTIEDNELIAVQVFIRGLIEIGMSLPLMLRFDIIDDINSTYITSFKLSSYNSWATFGFNMSLFSAYNPNRNQTINVQMCSTDHSLNVILLSKSNTASIIPSVTNTASIIPSVTNTASIIPSVTNTTSIIPSVTNTASIIPSVTNTASIIPSVANTTSTVPTSSPGSEYFILYIVIASSGIIVLTAIAVAVISIIFCLFWYHKAHQPKRLLNEQANHQQYEHIVMDNLDAHS